MFLIIEDFDIASYEDDSTPYMSVNNMDGVVKSFEEASIKLFQWFNDNLMKRNASKWHSLVSTNNTVNTRVENFDIKGSDCEKLLGIKFDYKLTSNSHISDLCKKASKLVHALARVTPYMNVLKRCIIMNDSVTAFLYGCVTVVS